MRHRSKKRILGREKAPREAMLANLATSLILYEKVRTTDGRARAVRSLVERLITRGRVKSIHAKQQLGKVLKDKKAVAKILDVYAPLYQGRPGGYTRTIKLKNRAGDNAKIVQIEFVK